MEVIALPGTMPGLYRNTVVQLSPAVLDDISEEDALSVFPTSDHSLIWLAKAKFLEQKIKEGFPNIELAKENPNKMKMFGLWSELNTVLTVL